MASSTWFTLHTMISRINIQTVTNFIFCTGELGFSLFEKKGRFLVLTKEGKEFLPYAMEVVESTKKAERSMNRIYQRHTGNIRFAYTRSIPPNYIPNLIRQFIEKYKDQDINIETYAVSTALILNDLKEDKIDFGFCSKGESMDENIKMIPLVQYPIKLVANENDLLCDLEEVHPKDLLMEPGISYTEGGAMDLELQQFFEEQNIHPNIHYRTLSEEIENFVSCGLGWAFVAQNETPMMAGLKSLNMPEMTLKRCTYLALRKDRQLGNAASEFLKFVRIYNKEYTIQ